MSCILQSRLFLGGLLALSLTLTALGQNKPVDQSRSGQANAAAKDAPRDALTFYSAGLEACLVDPKDQGLVKALRLIDDRVLDLPHELNQADIPAPAIQLALEMLLGPMSLRGGMIQNADPNAGPPFYLQWNFFAADQQQAQNWSTVFSRTVGGKLPMPAKPAPNMPGMTMLDMQGMPLYYGSFKAGGEPAFTIAVNKIDAGGLKLGAMDLPEKVNPTFAFVLETKQLQPVIDMFMAQAGPQGDMIKHQLSDMGMYGPNAMTVSVAAGHSADRSYSTARLTHYRQRMEHSKTLSTQRVSAADLKRIPADATYAQLSKLNLAGIGESIRAAAQQAGGEVGDPMDMIEKQTGVNPQRDIFDHLGQTMGFYMAESTGGGGFLSSVLFIEVKNPQALDASIARVRAKANELAAQYAKGYVRLAEKKVNNQSMTVLTFPGLPVPLELSIAIADGWLYVCASPQTLLAAISNGHAGKSSLLDNPRFKEAGGDKLDDVMQLSFTDTPRLMRDGYGIVSLGMAALANAVRSPSDAGRDAGLVMPSYSDLSKDARATLRVSRLQGDDLVMTGQGDRSLLVNACGAFGMMGGSTGTIATAAIAAGIMMPALGKAREAAKRTKSMAQLRQISMAVQTYAAVKDGAMPPSFQALIDGGYMTRDLLKSPMGPGPDPVSDYWIDFSVKDISKIEHPDLQVQGYDRAMYGAGGEVVVVFFDGHVEQMAAWQLKRAAKMGPNAGHDFGLPKDEADDANDH